VKWQLDSNDGGRLPEFAIASAHFVTLDPQTLIVLFGNGKCIVYIPQTDRSGVIWITMIV